MLAVTRALEVWRDEALEGEANLVVLHQGTVDLNLTQL
jgi:hypothetical protein